MNDTCTINDTVAAISQKVRSASDSGSLLRKLDEVKRLAEELLDPFDEATIKATEDRLLALLHSLDSNPTLDAALDSLSRQFAGLMRRWLRPNFEQQPDDDADPTGGRDGLPVAQPADGLSTQQTLNIAEQLQAILTTLKAASSYAPRDLNDVQVTEQILNNDLGMPLPVVWQILEDAEYWVRSVGRGGSLVVTAHDAEIQESLCCTAVVPACVKEYKPLRKVVFIIESRDQGWRSSNDGGSWTWFEAGSKDASRRLIVHNIAARRDYHTHRVQWNHSSHDETSDDAQLHEWMSGFTEGHELSIFARAQFGGWANHVQRAQVELYCACV